MRYAVEQKHYQYFVGRFERLTGVPHIHTHLEMVYLLKGHGEAAVDGRWYPLKEGELFLAGPDQIHFYREDEKTEFYLIIFAADMEAELEERLKGRVPAYPVIPAHMLPAGLRETLADIALRRVSEDACVRLGAKGQFLSLMSVLLPLYSYREESRADRDSFKQVLTYCAGHYAEPISLDSVAARLHLSKFYLSHLFRQRMDIGFAEFLNRLRTEDACRRLRKGEEITRTAYDAGFSSIRTFNRVFRATMGMTPRDYAARYAPAERRKNHPADTAAEPLSGADR